MSVLAVNSSENLKSNYQDFAEIIETALNTTTAMNSVVTFYPDLPAKSLAFKYTDPDGEVINLVAAGIGAAAGGAIGAGIAIWKGGSARDVAAAAAGGAVTGGLAGFTMGGSVAVGLAGGALAGMAGYTANNMVSGNETTAEGLISSGVSGAAGYAGGQVAGKVMGDVANMAKNPTTVIGRVSDIKNLGPSEKSLLDRLPNQGNPKANWSQNSSILRQEMSKGLPIRDASPGDTGGQFLNAERNLLNTRGWKFDTKTNYWMPPGAE